MQKHIHNMEILSISLIYIQKEKKYKEPPIKSQHNHICTLPSLCNYNWWHHSTHKEKSVLVMSSAFARVDKALFLCEFVTVSKLPSRALLRD